MVDYNVGMHIPQLLECFVQDFRAGDINKLKNDKTILMKLIQDKKYHNMITSCDNIRKTKYDKLVKKALESLKTIQETTKPEELFIDINEIVKDLGEALDEAEGDYWETIFAKTIDMINNFKENDEQVQQ